MSRHSRILNFSLFTAGVVSCLLANNATAILVTAIVIGTHLRQLKTQEWRLLIQLPVLGWVVDALFLRMHIVNVADELSLLARIGCWAILATTLCHSLYPLMRHLLTAALTGGIWGVIIYGVPILTGRFTTVLAIPLWLLSAMLSGALLLVLFSFVIRTRIQPDIEKKGQLG